MNRPLSVTGLLTFCLLLGACQPATSGRSERQPYQIKATGELMAATTVQVTPPALSSICGNTMSNRWLRKAACCQQGIWWYSLMIRPYKAPCAIKWLN